jgi:hypothetical protein
MAFSVRMAVMMSRALPFSPLAMAAGVVGRLSGAESARCGSTSGAGVPPPGLPFGWGES